jgi:hypothetical protein
MLESQVFRSFSQTKNRWRLVLYEIISATISYICNVLNRLSVGLSATKTLCWRLDTLYQIWHMVNRNKLDFIPHFIHYDSA